MAVYPSTISCVAWTSLNLGIKKGQRCLQKGQGEVGCDEWGVGSFITTALGPIAKAGPTAKASPIASGGEQSHAVNIWVSTVSSFCAHWLCILNVLLGAEEGRV